jgi:hypothetical protein
MAIRHVSDHIGLSDGVTATVSHVRHVSDHIGVADHADVSGPLVAAGPLTIRRSEARTIDVERGASPVPKVDVGLTKAAWDLTTSSAGVTIGGAIGHLLGAVIGGAILYGWGQWRWKTRR